MLAGLQIAHYVDGRRIAERAVLVDIATTLGLEPAAFIEALDRQSGATVQAHFREARTLMARVGAQGFPTFVLKTSTGMKTVDLSSYLGRPSDFQDFLRSQADSPATSRTAEILVCGVDGCAI